MNKETKKAERERAIFRQFINKSGLKISPESVVSCNPPEPDIICLQDNEGNVAFELVEICDQVIAHKIARITDEEFGFLRPRDPSAGILREKLRKNYQTKYPIELLCYTDGKTNSWDDLIIEEIRPILDMCNEQFRRVWLLGNRCQLVWEM